LLCEVQDFIWIQLTQKLSGKMEFSTQSTCLPHDLGMAGKCSCGHAYCTLLPKNLDYNQLVGKGTLVSITPGFNFMKIVSKSWTFFYKESIYKTIQLFGVVAINRDC
jgi:hypothetical protein